MMKLWFKSFGAQTFQNPKELNKLNALAKIQYNASERSHLGCVEPREQGEKTSSLVVVKQAVLISGMPTNVAGRLQCSHGPSNGYPAVQSGQELGLLLHASFGS